MSNLGDATWNGSEWIGPNVEKIEKYDKNQEARLEKTRGRSYALVNQYLDSNQIDQQVPFVIKDIVAANDSLSATGFGPKKAGGIALYAGRWVDPTTGSLRVLPKASLDYVNPTSLSQRIAYHQAKLINYWNNLMDQIQ